MKIAGYQPVTLLDYPEKVATIVFTQGCNLRCMYCQNSELLSDKLKGEENYLLDFIKYLENRKGKIEGVVITGGEPCLHPDLIQFIDLIRTMGYLVKLDTNGTYPERLKELIDNNMLDYIAMDIKAEPIRYRMFQLDGLYPEEREMQICNIRKSINIVMNSTVNYEFRTTCVDPILDPTNFKMIGTSVDGADKYYLQNYVKSDKVYRPSHLSPFTREMLEESKEILSKHVKYVEIRGEE